MVPGQRVFGEESFHDWLPNELLYEMTDVYRLLNSDLPPNILVYPMWKSDNLSAALVAEACVLLTSSFMLNTQQGL